MYKRKSVTKAYDKIMYEYLQVEANLQKLIEDEVEESPYLDFKKSDAIARSDSGKANISKDISSFANSDGSTLIYDMEELNHKASSIDQGIDRNDFTK